MRLAQNIQNKLAANFGVDDLGVRQANFYVIKRISMPAVLVEMCFISNEKELTLMKGQWFQKKTARLIAEGIERYLHNTEAARMRKLILLMLLLCAVIASGCSENVPPKEDAKNAATAAVQEKRISALLFIVQLLMAAKSCYRKNYDEG